MLSLLTNTRADALKIFKAAINAALPKNAIENSVRLIAETNELHIQDKVFNMKNYDSIRIIGFGKASSEMVSAVRKIVLPLKTKDIYGHVVTKHKHVKETDILGSSNDLPEITVTEASHPVPCKKGVNGTKTIIQILKNCTNNRTLILACVSGGGSALLVKPAPGITLSELQSTNEILLKNGLTINEMNTIRKHLSSVKGGKLARLAYPSTICSLILSDVIGDPLDIIASGPTVPDSSTFKDCLDIVDSYNLSETLPPNVYKHLQNGYKYNNNINNDKKDSNDSSEAALSLQETPKRGDTCFSNSYNFMIGNNSIAVEAAERKALELGYNSLILSTSVEGEAREVGIVFSSLMKEIMKSNRPIKKPACLIAGGETTVTVNINSNGNGGRQQELALSAAKCINGLIVPSTDNGGGGNVAVLLAGGTDGTDGPNDAAGAIVDGSTLEKGMDKNLDINEYLSNNDSYSYFNALDDGSLIKIGPTGTNVADVSVMIVR
jgi:glycerate 2-kinase